MALAWQKKLSRMLFAVTVPWALPNQSGNSGKYLTTNGSATSWGTVSAGVGGSNTQVQFNNSGVLAGDAEFVWDMTNNKLTLQYPGVAATQKTSLLLANTTAATISVNQSSPSIEWRGNAYNSSTSTSQSVNWYADILPTTSLNALSKFRLRSSFNGGSLEDALTIESRAGYALAYPHMTFPGSYVQTFTPESISFPFNTYTNASNSIPIGTRYKFGSTTRSEQYIGNDGLHDYRAAGAGPGFTFSTGTNMATQVLMYQITNTGTYTNGYNLNVGKLTAGTGTPNLPTTLAVQGSVGVTGKQISAATTLAYNTMDTTMYVCDPTNVYECTGTPSTACGSTSYAGCPARAAVGCVTTTLGQCSDQNSTDSGTCTGYNAACSWGSAACSTYNNAQSSCESAGFPSPQCTFTAAACGAYAADPSTCSGASGCSPDYGGSCSSFSSAASCDPYASLGCTTNYADCSGLSDGGGDGTNCATQPTCSYDSGSGVCSGSYFDTCTGSYYNGCSGTYAGADGACSGSYSTGICNGGPFGNCSGTGLCSNFSASGTCGGEAGCTWSNLLRIKLPSIVDSISGNKIGPLLTFKKYSSAGTVVIQRADSTADTIEGSTTLTLSSEWDKAILYPFQPTALCSAFNNNSTSCTSTSPCVFTPTYTCASQTSSAACSAVTGCTPDNTGDCGTLSDGGANGTDCATKPECSYDPGGTCSGTFFAACNGTYSGGLGTCTGVYPNAKVWLKY